MPYEGIEWTEKTWNPVTGCTKVSAGCKHCYAEVQAKRLMAMGNPRYTHGFKLTLHADKVDEPRRWRKPLWVFVNSMSDLLHPDVPLTFITDCFETMASTPHVFQILTKRPERWTDVDLALPRWPQNIMPGTSIESVQHLDRLEGLAQAGSSSTIRMISAEPLLGSLVETTTKALGDRLHAAGIGWVITGGESGHHARPAELDWFREIRDACGHAGIPFFHKQHGGRGTTKPAKRGGQYAELDGELLHAIPTIQPAAPVDAGQLFQS